VVLRDGQGAERAVEGSAGAGEQALVEERRGVHLPDARHPGHARRQGALEGGVERRVVGGAAGGGDRPRGVDRELRQVRVPQLVRSRERPQRPLVDGHALRQRRLSAR